MKGRQKLCRRLSKIFFNREIFTGCVLCEISDQRGGRNSHSYLSKACSNPGKKKMREEDRGNVFSRCVEQMARALFHLLFLANLQQFSNLLSPPPSLSPPSLYAPRFSYFPLGKEKRKKSGRNKCNTRFQALINFSSLGSVNSCVLLLSTIET